jgi:site-specific DNA recombinase
VPRAIELDDEIIALMAEALREGHRDERQFHDEAIARLQAEHTKLQTRLDAMYADKLDGVIDRAFYERKANEWRGE